MALKLPYHPDAILASDGQCYVGMYQYDHEKNIRAGGIVKIDPKAKEVTKETLQVGVLDMREGPNSTILAACSDGRLREYDDDLEEVRSVGLFCNEESEVKRVCICVDSAEDGRIACLSAGGVLAVVDSTAWKPVTVFPSSANTSVEYWACGISPSGNLVATGGDDMFVRVFDLRAGETPVLQNRREHEMGITSFYFPSEDRMYSGSYDEKLKFWDLDSGRVVDAAHTSGGVWRIKPAVDEPDRLLIAGCFGGCDVVAAEGPSLECVGTYGEHGSMVYGVASLGGGDVATCSFYDNEVHFWNYRSLACAAHGG